MNSSRLQVFIGVEARVAFGARRLQQVLRVHTGAKFADEYGQFGDRRDHVRAFGAAFIIRVPYTTLGFRLLVSRFTHAR